MQLTQHEFSIPRLGTDSFDRMYDHVRHGVSYEGPPVRFAIVSSDDFVHRCEVSVVEHDPSMRSIFDFQKRTGENADVFNVVLLIPTGIGAEIGGHAGDAGPVARLLAAVCDTLILHPNIVNASDINEMPENSLYVEGSVICRLLMGTVQLARVRSNRILVVIGAHEDQQFVDAAINSVNAARSTYGLSCSVLLNSSIRLRTAYSSSGSAVGHVDNLGELLASLRDRRSEYDAIAITSVIDVPHEFHMDYFKGGMINPWGGVEAMLTHAVSAVLDVPSAHAPMFDSREIADINPGQVDPRMAAEAVSFTFLQCVLKGLHRSPRIVETDAPNSIAVKDVSCLVIPDGCLGLPTLAALKQGISVIAVRENRNVMRNDLQTLPWAPGQLHIIDNYWEVVGILAAMKAGIDPMSVRRPLSMVKNE